MNSVLDVIWTQVFYASIAATYITYAIRHIQKGRKLQLEEALANISITEFREIIIYEVIKSKLGI